MKTLLTDLGEAYKKLNMNQNRMLLGSMFLAKFAWNESGTFKYEISWFYQAIQRLSEDTGVSGAGEGT